jgi:hypothetical protein
MNRVEQECSMLLLAKQQTGKVLWFAYEAIKLRLSDNQYYTPDFDVLLDSGIIELWEVKTTWKDGRVGMREDAWEKLKMAAEQHPFVFRLVVKRLDGGWDEKII